MSKAHNQKIRNILLESAAVKQRLAWHSMETIEAMALQMSKSLRRGGKIVFFGNGGSATDSSHLATEFVGRLCAGRERRPLPAIALSTDISLITCLANDYGYENIFERPVQALVDKKDTVVGISTSGNSLNVIKGIRSARKKGAFTMALTGKTGERLAREAKLSLKVPSADPGRIQEGYLCVGHILCELVEDILFPGLHWAKRK